MRSDTQHPSSLLSQEETADMLGLDERTLEKWRETGRYALPFVKIGARVVRYRLTDIEAFIQRNMVKVNPEPAAATA